MVQKLNGMSSRLNAERSAIPVMIPGSAIGKITSRVTTSRPKKRAPDTAAAQSVPRMSATSVEIAATPERVFRAIASSGEISRLMLAIKSALAAHDAIPLLVFDEIDTNVGGEIAHAVGAKMQTLGRNHQVICITHLPQVAATASLHFVVTKDVARGRTFSNLHEVTGKARQEEIARMLGGKSDSALKLAATLLKQK